MGDPKIQRSDAGFFTRLGRAIDAFGGDAPKAKSGPSQKQMDAVQPLPKKYKATPRRLDRSVVSAPVSDSAAYKIQENETYVANALKLVDDMRALAVKEDSWYNRTTPKDVDKVTNKYKPLLLAAAGATSLEKSEMRKQLAVMMLKELYETPTADNLFWVLADRAPYPVDIKDLKNLEHIPMYELMNLAEEKDRMAAVEPYQCTLNHEQVSCWNGAMADARKKSCVIGGVKKAYSTNDCPSEPKESKESTKF